jgi:uncharacterized repeat protein (TIGR02543 family)
VEILNLGGAADNYSPASKSRKKLRVILGIGALAVVTGLGSTLAANISLNGGGNVEFGQGVATTAACDDSITLTPVSTFVNSPYAGDATFGVSAIQISDIDLTPEGWNVDTDAWHVDFNNIDGTWDAGSEREGQYYADSEWINTCEGKYLMLRAYTDNEAFAEYTVDDSINSPLFLNSVNSSGALRNAGVAFQIAHSGDSSWNEFDDVIYADENENYTYSSLDLIVNINVSADAYGYDSTVTIDLDSDNAIAPLDSRWVDKLTLESADTLPTSWNAEVLTVSYDTDGGSPISNTSTTVGGSVDDPGAPTQTGYSFIGWSASATDGGSMIGSWPYTHNETANFTLYAVWGAI